LKYIYVVPFKTVDQQGSSTPFAIRDFGIDWVDSSGETCDDSNLFVVDQFSQSRILVALAGVGNHALDEMRHWSPIAQFEMVGK
jgi:hypothetical protein